MRISVVPPGSSRLTFLCPLWLKLLWAKKFDFLSGMFPPAGTIPGKTRKRTSETIAGKIQDLGEKYLAFKQHTKDFLALLADEIDYTFHYLVKKQGVYPGDI